MLVCRSHIPKAVWEKVRGFAERRAAKQNSHRGLKRGWLESGGPFCHTSPVDASGAIWTPASMHPHQPILHPPPPAPLLDRTVHVNESWPEWSRPQFASVERNQLCFPSNAIFFFLPLTLFFPLSHNNQLCVFLLVVCSLKSLVSFEASWTQYENLAIDSCPLYYAATPHPPPPLSPRLFSSRILAVSCDYRFAELLLTWGGPSTVRRPYFIPHEGVKLMESRGLERDSLPHSAMEKCTLIVVEMLLNMWQK